jgi:teichoic acid transport system permease protein
MASTTADLDGLREPGFHGSWRTYAGQLWARRDYLWNVPRSELRSQQMNTALGNIWHLLLPLLSIGIYYLIFGLIVRTDRGIDNFIAFLAVGVFTFQFTQKSVTSGASSLVKNRGLLRSISFPRAMLPLTSVITEALAFLPGLAVIFFTTVVSGGEVRLTWLALLPILVLQFVFNTGASLVFARATSMFDDVKNLLPFLFRLLFYCSGVLFSVEAYVKSDLALFLFNLNPIYDVITLSRWAVLGTSVDPWCVVFLAGWAVISLVAGLIWFRRAEATYGG